MSPGAGLALLVLHRAELGDRRTVEDAAVPAEPRAVTGTVPAPLGRVPVHDAPEVSAHCGPPMQPPLSVAVHGDLLHALADHCARVRRNVILGADVTRPHPVGVLHGD